MHREIYERLEEVLSGTPPELAEEHLKQCGECRDKVVAMRAQAALVRQLKPTAEAEPRAGFYARVLERIEAEGPVSIWNLFVESAFGKRIAVASLALAVLLGAYLVSIERSAEPMVAAGQPSDQPAGQSSAMTCVAPACGAAVAAAVAPSVLSTTIPGEDAPGVVLTRLDQEPPNAEPNQDINNDMLVNLVTYREQ
jgi:predicted anti-sigma-YlaC factor YlaD